MRPVCTARLAKRRRGKRARRFRPPRPCLVLGPDSGVGMYMRKLGPGVSLREQDGRLCLVRAHWDATATVTSAGTMVPSLFSGSMHLLGLQHRRNIAKTKSAAHKDAIRILLLEIRGHSVSTLESDKKSEMVVTGKGPNKDDCLKRTGSPRALLLLAPRDSHLFRIFQRSQLNARRSSCSASSSLSLVLNGGQQRSYPLSLSWVLLCCRHGLPLSSAQSQGHVARRGGSRIRPRVFTSTNSNVPSGHGHSLVPHDASRLRPHPHHHRHLLCQPTPSSTKSWTRFRASLSSRQRTSSPFSRCASMAYPKTAQTHHQTFLYPFAGPAEHPGDCHAFGASSGARSCRS